MKYISAVLSVTACVLVLFIFSLEIELFNFNADSQKAYLILNRIEINDINSNNDDKILEDEIKDKSEIDNLKVSIEDLNTDGDRRVTLTKNFIGHDYQLIAFTIRGEEESK